ncbi:hypothetical protein CMUS01_10125 [Colletotrichum musicola]|uniref:Uncharacterized protein n=1 Tax=Colletotrichum musicola TaxID=2175873 RepID=A0A8H6K4T1_9PEZI|nr:hypothetical protein CMUS01_10125 [Colletotrichum musicola]
MDCYPHAALTPILVPNPDDDMATDDLSFLRIGISSFNKNTHRPPPGPIHSTGVHFRARPVHYRLGMREMNRVFSEVKCDKRVVKYYRLSYNRINRNLAPPLCQLMLMSMITATVASLTATPE